MSKPADLVQGTLDMLLLKILALEPLNGFSISQRLRQVSGDVLQVSDGSLYPALHKLEEEGWIKSEWKMTENKRRAKVLCVDPAGPQATRKRSAELEPTCSRDFRRSEFAKNLSARAAMRAANWIYTLPLKLRSLFRRRQADRNSMRSFAITSRARRKKTWPKA